ncbi:MAG: cobamide remodeling phosphodiesterase CbiR [Kiritimatiellia bacterium]|jgi:sugar phosphate isomerase/epimerase|nr:cobamide remodeling phosphodiesterase CbiR [Kiritimatiellia bacterium]MDP6630136.1 cobamide remodeling phosphodiesterase CbiR [Kiritimatiellia bacterium]MDP6810637.1 cobamide remodeling phosphodiesterase CbiR [Kiritimatiellia bacterium]MDP7023722.1 cobamide remodeling phosphodiesterase CbiR [Kiritimatiellia bacterium]
MSLDGIPSVKGRFPFRVGTTSYIIPADILPNVRALAPLVDDIELLLFEIPEMTNVPSPASIQELRQLAEENSLSFTVHLPIDLQLGHSDDDGRRQSVDACKSMIEATTDLDAFATVLHVDAFDTTSREPTPAADIESWTENVSRSIEDILVTGVPSRHLCVETLAYRFEFLAPIIESYDLGVCLDIGHILLYGFDLEEHLDRYFTRTRVLHAHGIRDGKDHRGLEHLDPAALDRVLQTLSADADTPRVLTLEVFSEPHFASSMRTMHSLLPAESA